MEQPITAAAETPPSPAANRILCYYVNLTKYLQIAKLPSALSEKPEYVVFPQQRVLFEALPDTLIEIYTYSTIDGVTLLDEIPCQQLQVQSGGRSD